jgi:hypothetical protein
MAGEGPADGKRERVGRFYPHLIAEIGKDRDGIEQVIGIGAAADDMQGQIDLGAGKALHGARQVLRQISPGMRSCMPG